MKSTPVTKTVADLLELKKANMLAANPEYQRGIVWTPSQKKRLIDSLLRGYPIPLIYLHHIKREVAGAKREDFEVIDGQQRLNALYEFSEGAFKLFDPRDEDARFPSFIAAQPCLWANKTFDGLAPDLQKQFRETPLAVVLIETPVENEARDLFIRLQAGMPLNSQEKRDAWPGNFTEFILKTGGKPQIPKYPGHDFFKRVMKGKSTERGDLRQLAAQMTMLLSSRRETGRLCDINREGIDTFYYTHLAFDPASEFAKRCHECLDVLTALLGDGKRSKILGHEAIHLVLIVDSLLDDYTPSWHSGFAAAFDNFRLEATKAKKHRLDAAPPEHWVRYGQLTRTNSDRADNILRRHEFFVEKMYERLKPERKDSTRLFGAVEREIIYARDGKKCQAIGCGQDVIWTDAEFHHVVEHSKGGKTTIENGVLVHKQCHPKGDAATQAFADAWMKRKASAGS